MTISTPPVPKGNESSDSPAIPGMTRRVRWRRMNPAAKYALAFGTLAVIAIAALFMLHAMNAAPRDSRAIADRELQVNVLAPGERVVSAISVYRRGPVDYFRATRGVLALTDKRMVFLGLRPRDLLSAGDAPPTFDEQDFPFDTLVAVESGRALGGLTKGIVVRTPHETLRLGVAASSWPEAQKLVTTMTNRLVGAHASGVQQQSLQKIADAEWKQAVETWQKAQYYTVRRGDALGSVATQWNTTPRELQRLNNLPNNNIRVGQTLLVRSAM
jgi:LysM domain